MKSVAIMKVPEIIKIFEAIAPPHLAEDWDNVGLLIGDKLTDVKRLMPCIDLTMPVLKEAHARGANLVMAYHPPIFKPISRVTASDTPVAYAAARMGLAVYSMHTALDAAVGGTHDVLADATGMAARRPIESPAMAGRCKIVVFAPPGDLERISEAAFEAGAGRIGDYSRCGFFTNGVGTFLPGKGASPKVRGERAAGSRQEFVDEVRLEMVAPRSKAAAIVLAVRGVHSYEEPAIDVYPLDDYPPGCGRGRIGELERPTSLDAILRRLKRAAGVKNVLVAKAADKGRKAQTVACAAGAGGSLLKAAIKQDAQVFVTGEVRHHDALAAAASGITVICLGHSNSERMALARVAQRLRDAMPGLPVVLSRADRDPFEIV